MTQISLLGNTMSFQTWFDTTNTIITELNGVSMHKGFGGDGVGVSYDASGNYTFNHGTNVATGVTFTGPIVFNNTVQFNGVFPNMTTTTISFTPKISGLTSGNVVTVSPTLGLTLAKANSAANSEVFGIVVNHTASSTVVAVGGSVNNTLFGNTIRNCLGIVGATLSPGQAYFLDPVISGGITTIEPVTYGQVSKPVLLGITGDAGLFLPYRGIIIEGISAGITAELDNKIIVEIKGTTTDSRYYNTNTSISVGDPVLYYNDQSTNDDAAASGDNLWKFFGTFNGSANRNIGVLNGTTLDHIIKAPFLGLVSKILSSSVVASELTTILEVTTPGGSFVCDTTSLDGDYYTDTGKTSKRIWSSGSGFTLGNNLASKFLDFIKIDANTTKIILNNTQIGSDVAAFNLTSTNNQSTSGTEYDNLIINGAFSVWQRGITGLTQGSLSAYSTPFADRWFVIKNNISGLTASVTRQEFLSTDTNVPGSPLYYSQCNFKYTNPSNLTKRPKLENIQKQARFLQSQNGILSFWAKSSIDGATLNTYYNRYLDTYSSTLGVTTDLENRVLINSAGGTTLTTNWQEYKQTFTVNPWNLLTTSEVGWFGLGFEFPSSNAIIDLAQVQLDFQGSDGPVFYVEPEKELERCVPYYQRTYDLNQITGQDYSGNNSTLNEYVLQTSVLRSDEELYSLKFNTQMVGRPLVEFYTPNGMNGDALNVNAGCNMANSSTGNLVTYPWSTTNFYRSSSSDTYGNIQYGNTSKNGMDIIIKNGAISFDIIKFHYVADADINLNV